MDAASTGAEPVKRAGGAAPAQQTHNGASLFAGRFSGRTAIVTGGASGLGLLTARRIIQEGGRVSVWDLNPDTIENAKQALDGAHAVRVDVGDYTDVVAATRRSREALGRIDILVNCAGITGATVPVQDFPVENWLQVININLNGIFFAAARSCR